jgi:serine protease Do
MREYENDFDYDIYDGYYGRKMGALVAPQEEPKHYSFSKKGVALITTLCILISGVFGFGGAYIANYAMGPKPATFLQSARPAQVEINLDDAATGKALSVQQVISAAADAVVEIRTEKVTEGPWLRQYVTQGAGSGVVVTTDGYIMTNNHVIRDSNKITVRLNNGKDYEARLIGYDSQTDVAVIKIEANGLTPVVFGDSDNITIGEPVVAIGNPLGELGGTATQGIISSLDRLLTIEGRQMSLLQTDASINPGNSGGGLFNEYGEIIGLVVAKSEGSGIEGLGFAIPINTAKNVAAMLIESGYVTGRPMIGIVMVELTSAEEAVKYGVRQLGVYIESVTSENAKKAGFMEGDMLYFIGDARVEKPSDLTDALQQYKVGDSITVTVVRDNAMLELTVVLSERLEN